MTTAEDNRSAEVASPKADRQGLNQRRPIDTPVKQKPTGAAAKGVETGKGGTKAAEKSGPEALWAWYLDALTARPLLTKGITAGAISAAGNLGCQLSLESVDVVDMPRIWRFALLNIAFVTPVLHVWFGFLNAQIPRPGLSGAVLRLLPDQLVFAPCFNFCLLTVLFSITSGQFQMATWDQLEDTMLSNWKLWPLANLLIFWLVPEKVQLLVGNFVTLLWNVYLSSKA